MPNNSDKEILASLKEHGLELQTYPELVGVLEAKDKYAYHIENWKNCKRCSLQGRINKRCVVDTSTALSGRLDMLFIGGAPSSHEALANVTFGSNANVLLRRAIKAANPYSLSYSFLHATACPAGVHKVVKNEHIRACFPRIEEYCKLTQPRCIIGVGPVGSKVVNLIDDSDIRTLVTKIKSPSDILSQGYDSESYRNYVRKLQSIISQLIIR